MPSLSAIFFPFILLFCFAVSLPADGPVQDRLDSPVQNFERLGSSALCSSHYVLQPQDDKCITVVAKFPDLGYGARGLANFYAWNPQVNSPSCDNLHVGQQYCVGAMDLDVVCPLRRGRLGDSDLGDWRDRLSTWRAQAE